MSLYLYFFPSEVTLKCPEIFLVLFSWGAFVGWLVVGVLFFLPRGVRLELP